MQMCVYLSIWERRGRVNIQRIDNYVTISELTAIWSPPRVLAPPALFWRYETNTKLVLME